MHLELDQASEVRSNPIRRCCKSGLRPNTDWGNFGAMYCRIQSGPNDFNCSLKATSVLVADLYRLHEGLEAPSCVGFEPSAINIREEWM